MPTAPEEFLSKGTGNPLVEEPHEDKVLPRFVTSRDPDTKEDSYGEDHGY